MPQIKKASKYAGNKINSMKNIKEKMFFVKPYFSQEKKEKIYTGGHS
jgi:hypothetical protein